QSNGANRQQDAGLHRKAVPRAYQGVSRLAQKHRQQDQQAKDDSPGESDRVAGADERQQQVSQQEHKRDVDAKLHAEELSAEDGPAFHLYENQAISTQQSALSSQHSAHEASGHRAM